MSATAHRLGPYELGERIGAGGMGEVYLARHVGIAGFHRRVAVKRVRPAAGDGEGDAEARIERFVDEARVAALLVHPGIVAVYDFGRDGDGFYLVMEYVDGASLASVVGRGARLALDVAAHVIAGVARAVDHAHRARDLEGRPLRVVHRDISPHNVLVSRDGDVKLADFGIARADNQLSRTATGAVLGKVAYMAPEQLAGRAVDGRADVFSLGVMLWELTLGAAAFPAGAARSVEAVVPPPASVDRDYPADLAAIVTAAVAGDPEARTATAGELAGALDGFLDRRGVRVRREQIAALVPDAAPAAAVRSPTASAGSAGVATVRHVRALRAGDVVGDYEITEVIGEGGMGVVYAAIDHRIGKRAAIKVLRHPAGADEGAVGRLLDEARAVNRIGHPSIIDIFGFGTLDGGGVYCVMELLAGQTLRALLGGRPPLTPREAVALLAPVAAAIDAGHRAGVVHCDLTPDNVFVCERGEGERAIKVLDFGLARSPGGSSPGAPELVGTPRYMAPEQCRGERGDHRIDVYAFGVILYQAITGRHPFGDLPPFALLAAHVEAEPAPPSQHGAPAAVDAAILRCLARQPADRFDSLTAALAVFEAAATPRAPAPRRISRRTAGGLAVGGTVVVAVAAYAMAGQRRGDPHAALEAASVTVGQDSAGHAGPGQGGDLGMNRDAASGGASGRGSDRPGAAGVDASVPRIDVPGAARPGAAPTSGDPAARPAAAARPRPVPSPLHVAVKTASAFDDPRAIERTLQASEAGLRHCMAGATLPPVFAVSFKVAPLDGKPTGGIESTWPEDLQEAAAIRCLAEVVQQLSFGPAARGINDPYVPVTVEIATGAGPSSPLDARLLAESRARLGAKLAAECTRGAAALPPSIAFDVRVDRAGRVFDAELVQPADLDGATAACLRRWLKNWTFLPADAETRGRLAVTLPRR